MTSTIGDSGGTRYKVVAIMQHSYGQCNEFYGPYLDRAEAERAVTHLASMPDCRGAVVKEVSNEP
jgi:hypothetical protein